MEKKVGIFIPARLASERLPNKLALPLNKEGLTLFEIACRKLQYLSKKYKCYALVYDAELRHIAQKYNIEVIDRTIETTQIDGPMTTIFGDLKDNVYEGLTHLMFLNPCLYNLNINTIESSIEAFKTSKAESATSVKEIKNWVWTNDRKPLIPADYKTLSTKDINGFLQAAHCFHIFHIRQFFHTGNMLDEKHALIQVDKMQTLDVDDEADYEMAKIMLPKLRKKYVIDIDGTICTQEKDYRDAKPISENIDKVRRIHADGHEILYFTARGTETGIDWNHLTTSQLRNWGLPQYQNLQFGKPSADYYVDDRAFNADVEKWQ